MGLLTFPPDNMPVIADASVWINLASTGHAQNLIKAIPNRLFISNIALSELERGRVTGRTTISEMEGLIRQGLASVVECSDEADETYLGLVSGSAQETLDDGEACTLAYAHHAHIAALIDERKATRVAACRFPSVIVLSTVDLMLSQSVRSKLGDDLVSDALFNALAGAYMRVPSRSITEVLNLLGEERSWQCTSLPASARLRSKTSSQ